MAARNRPGKALPEAQAVTVYGAKAMQSEADFEAFARVPDLLRWGLRSSLTAELTGLPDILIKRIVKRDGIHAPHGRFSLAITTLFETPLIHLSASLFIAYIKARVSPIERVIDAAAFHAAYRSYLVAVAPSTPALHPNIAYKVACERWKQRELRTVDCGTCGTMYLQSVEVMEINSVTTHGDCPLCRQLAAKDGFTPLVIGQARAHRAKKALDALGA